MTPEAFAVKVSELTRRFDAALKEAVDETERLRARLAVRCEQPNVAQCARLWQADNERRQLMAVSPALAEEFPWGCDTVEHLAAALVASRAELARLQRYKQYAEELLKFIVKETKT